MKSGDKVYRIVMPRPANKREQPGPRVESVEVIGIGPSKIQLKNKFSDLFKQQVPSRYLGIMFFPTEQEAFIGFVREKRDEMDKLQQEIDRTARLILWAEEKLKTDE